MRHAKAEDLAGIAPLLDRIRKVRGIREKGTAHFYFRGRSVIHFHVDEDLAVYADIGDTRIKVKGMHARIMKTLAYYIRSIDNKKK